jgi:hypothetical protein
MSISMTGKPTPISMAVACFREGGAKEIFDRAARFGDVQNR